MAIYKGNITSFDLSIKSTTLTDYTRLIHLQGDFGLAFLYFVPDGKALKPNAKRDGENIFDVWYRIEDWTPIVELLWHKENPWFWFEEENKAAGVRTTNVDITEYAL